MARLRNPEDLADSRVLPSGTLALLAHAVRRGPWQRRLTPYLLFLPAGLLLVTLNFLTSGYGVFLSFLDFNYFRIEHRFDFVGLRHYIAVFQDRVFWTAARNSLVWSLCVVPGSLVVGFYFALLLHEDIKARGALRTILLLPWVTPLVVVAILWAFILSPGFGLLSDILVRLGRVDLKYENWLADPGLALPIVMGVQIWRWAPFFAIVLLAGMQSIPEDLYNAAEMDGAGALARFRHVTLPLIRPVITVLLLQGLIWSAQNFSLIFIMTGGGPVHASEVLTVYLWRTAFPHGRIGEAAAAGAVLMAILSVVGTVWVLKILRQGED